MYQDNKYLDESSPSEESSDEKKNNSRNLDKNLKQRIIDWLSSMFKCSPAIISFSLSHFEFIFPNQISYLSDTQKEELEQNLYHRTKRNGEDSAKKIHHHGKNLLSIPNGALTERKIMPSDDEVEIKGSHTPKTDRNHFDQFKTPIQKNFLSTETVEEPLVRKSKTPREHKSSRHSHTEVKKKLSLGKIVPRTPHHPISKPEPHNTENKAISLPVTKPLLTSSDNPEATKVKSADNTPKQPRRSSFIESQFNKLTPRLFQNTPTKKLSFGNLLTSKKEKIIKEAPQPGSHPSSPRKVPILDLSNGLKTHRPRSLNQSHTSTSQGSSDTHDVIIHAKAPRSPRKSPRPKISQELNETIMNIITAISKRENSLVLNYSLKALVMIRQQHSHKTLKRKLPDLELDDPENTDLHILSSEDRKHFHHLIKSIVQHSPIDKTKFGNTGAYYFYCAYIFHVVCNSESQSNRNFSLTLEEMKWGIGANSQTDIFSSIITEEDHWTWSNVRSLGLPVLMQKVFTLKEITQLIAKAEWKKSRDPNKCALFYIAAKKISVLAQIFRETDIKVTKFLERYQEDPESAVVLKACRENAYRLISAHRYELALAFFLLAGDTMAAVNIALSRLKDWQLGIFIARVMEESEPELYHKIIIESLIPGHVHNENFVRFLNSLLNNQPGLPRKSLITLYEENGLERDHL